MMGGDWIEFGGTFEAFQKLHDFGWHKDPVTGRVVDGQGSLAGLLVEIEKSDDANWPPRIQLIGHTNENGGGCDDCPNISGGDRILRYKRVWQP